MDSEIFWILKILVVAGCQFWSSKQRVLLVSLFSWFSFLKTTVFFEIWNPTHTTPQTERNDSQEYLGQELSLEELFFLVGFLQIFCFLDPEAFQKPQGKPPKKTKQTKDSQECLGQGLCSEAFFGVFGSGNFSRLLGLPKAKKNTRKTKKN